MSRLAGAGAPALTAAGELIPAESEIDSILNFNVMALKNGQGAVVSSLPLAVPGTDATERDPRWERADLRWTGETDGGVRVRRAIGEITAPARAGGSVRVGPFGIRLADPNSPAIPAVPEEADETVVYPSIDADTATGAGHQDLVVRSLPSGIAAGWVLRTPQADRNLNLDLDLPEGYRLRDADPKLGPDLRILDADGKVAGTVSPVAATAADGTPVPVSTTVDGSTVRYQVQTPLDELALPLVVDPWVLFPPDEISTVVGNSWSGTDTSFDGWMSALSRTGMTHMSTLATAAVHPTVNGLWMQGAAAVRGTGLNQYFPAPSDYAAWIKIAPGNANYGDWSPAAARNISVEHGSWWRADVIYDYQATNIWPDPGLSVGFWARNATPMTTQTKHQRLITAPATYGPEVAGAFATGLLEASLIGQGFRTYIGTNATTPPSTVRPNPSTESPAEAAASNLFDFGLVDRQWNGAATRPVTAARIAWIKLYAADNVNPTIVAPATDPGWLSEEDELLPVRATDQGAGIKRLAIENTSGDPFPNATIDPACDGASVLNSSNQVIGNRICEFDTNAHDMPLADVPEGAWNLVARDGTANTATQPIKIDRTAPELTLSGDLFDDRATEYGPTETRPLVVQTADGIPGTNVAAHRSGVERVEVYVDDELVHDADQTTPGDNQPLNTTWTPPAGTFTSGDYVVRVLAYDRVGHDEEAAFTVKAPCCGDPLEDDDASIGSRLHDFGDVDGDGATDVVLVDPTTGAIGVRKGEGDGTFGTEESWGSFATAVDKIAVGDVDPDGVENAQDLVARATDDALLLRVSTGSAFEVSDPSGMSDLQTQWPPDRTLELADVDGDGKADVVGMDSTSRQVRVGYSLGAAFEASASWATVASGVQAPLGDLNGDGLADLVIYDPATGEVTFRESTGETFAAASEWGTASASADVATGDLDANGLDDLVFRTSSGAVNGRVSSRDGGFDGAARPLGNIGTTFALHADDLTGDDRADVLGARVQSGTLETRSVASTIRDSNAPDSSPTDPDDEGAGGFSAKASAVKKADIMMSDENGVKYGTNLAGYTRGHLLQQMKHLGATKVRTIAWWGAIDRLHPEDQATLTPVDPASTPVANQSETVRPELEDIRTVRLARDATDHGDDVAVDDPQPEWIPNPGGANPLLRSDGEWVIVRDRLFVKQLDITLGAIQSGGLKAHVTVSGGTSDFTVCPGPEAPLRITPTDTRGCKHEKSDGGTGDRPNPKRAGHALASIAEYLRVKYPATVESIGVWNEPNLSSDTFFSRRGTKVIKDRRGQLDRSHQYGEIYAWTWKQLKDRGMLSSGSKRVRIAFGELSSAKTKNDGHSNGTSVRVMDNEKWTNEALEAAAAAHDDWPEDVVRADIFAVHPYQNVEASTKKKDRSSRRPWQLNEKYPWGVRGVAASIRKKNGDVKIRGVKAFLNRAATSGEKSLRKVGGGGRPDIWATEFGYFNVKGNSRLGFTNDALRQGHPEAERTRYLRYTNKRTTTRGALPGMSQQGDVKVIGFWEVMEDPQQWQTLGQMPDGTTTVDDYGLFGSGAPNVAWYTGQTLKVSGNRPYDPPPRSLGKDEPLSDSIARTVPRTAACAIRTFSGTSAPAAATGAGLACP